MSNTVPSKFKHKDQIAEILENIDLVLPPGWNRKREARGFVRNERPFEHHVNTAHGDVGSALRIQHASVYGSTAISSEESTNRQGGHIETVTAIEQSSEQNTNGEQEEAEGRRVDRPYWLEEEEVWADDEGDADWGIDEEEAWMQEEEHETEADSMMAEEEVDLVHETSPTDAMDY
ncbi:hypothetical protein OE88DRAFT_1727369 [Heliocybe sulcata]|uniref:Uncharacterized protein n=1 Tax=Heliocybe sulcata TaxID=5364 RepID=A0A5C3MZ52_9AGAM|nr:hypothetical protein OE88DRAFT_1727369 [Heliocybe sulcata]